MSHSLKYFYFLCQCSFKYLTEFYTPKLSIGIRERGTGTLVFEGIAERCDLISHLQAIRPEWEKRTGLLKKPQPSQPRGSSRSLRSGQVPTRQTHVCKTSIGRKMLRLQRISWLRQAWKGWWELGLGGRPRPTTWDAACPARRDRLDEIIVPCLYLKRDTTLPG